MNGPAAAPHCEVALALRQVQALSPRSPDRVAEADDVNVALVQVPNLLLHRDRHALASTTDGSIARGMATLDAQAREGMTPAVTIPAVMTPAATIPAATTLDLANRPRQVLAWQTLLYLQAQLYC